jgi:hypothetical protein
MTTPALKSGNVGVVILAKQPRVSRKKSADSRNAEMGRIREMSVTPVTFHS